MSGSFLCILPDRVTGAYQSGTPLSAAKVHLRPGFFLELPQHQSSLGIEIKQMA